MADPQQVAAPGLREVAEVWWDAEVDPVVRWSEGGRRYVLAGGAGTEEIELAVLVEAPADPRVVAQVLAEGLAACDFPPTGDGAAPASVRATLSAAGRRDALVDVARRPADGERQRPSRRRS